ncbi:hypothetical protein [Tenacibaculum sp.]|uniref:hypothetical protein n=2 Tax=Pseudomonadati TaxID=3379134 RepID=UPI003AA99270
MMINSIKKISECQNGRFLSILFILYLICFVSVFVFFPNAHFSIDEIVYNMMARDIWRGDFFHIKNGYDVFPFDSMTMLLLKPNEGELSSQYPILYPLISAPFVSFLGIKGLVFVSMTAHFFSIYGIYKISAIFLKNRSLCIFVSLVFGFGTFSLEYALSAFSHSLSASALLFSIYFLVINKKLKYRNFFLSGLFIGLATLVRLDSILILAAIAVWGLGMYRFPQAIKNGGVIAFGFFPSILILSGINFVKFGTFNPFTYGTSVVQNEDGYDNTSAHFPLLLLIVSFLLSSIFYKSMSCFLVESTRKIIFSFVFLLVLLYLVNLIYPFIFENIYNGIVGLFFDMRYLGILSPEPAMKIAENGSILYYGIVKKSLFESLPILSVGMFSIILYFFKNKDYFDSRLLLIWMSALFLVLPFLILGWHGGLSYNQRYFIPVIPFLLLLSLLVFERYLCTFYDFKNFIYGGFCIVIISKLILIIYGYNEIYVEIITLYLPLFLSVSMFLISISCIFLEGGKRLRLVVSFFVGVSVFLGVIKTFNDIKSHFYVLSIYEDQGSHFIEYMNEKTVLITNYNEAYSKALESDTILTMTGISQNKDIVDIVNKSMIEGYTVFLVVDEAFLSYLYEIGSLKDLNVCEKALESSIYLFELRKDGCE